MPFRAGAATYHPTIHALSLAHHMTCLANPVPRKRLTCPGPAQNARHPMPISPPAIRRPMPTGPVACGDPVHTTPTTHTLPCPLPTVLCHPHDHRPPARHPWSLRRPLPGPGRRPPPRLPFPTLADTTPVRPTSLRGSDRVDSPRQQLDCPGLPLRHSVPTQCSPPATPRYRLVPADHPHAGPPTTRVCIAPTRCAAPLSIRPDTSSSARPDRPKRPDDPQLAKPADCPTQREPSRVESTPRPDQSPCHLTSPAPGFPAAARRRPD